MDPWWKTVIVLNGCKLHTNFTDLLLLVYISFYTNWTVRTCRTR